MPTSTNPQHQILSGRHSAESSSGQAITPAGCAIRRPVAAGPPQNVPRCDLGAPHAGMRLQKKALAAPEPEPSISTASTSMPPAPSEVSFSSDLDWMPGLAPLMYVAIAWFAVARFLVRPLREALIGEGNQPRARSRMTDAVQLSRQWSEPIVKHVPPGAGEQSPPTDTPKAGRLGGSRGGTCGAYMHRWVREIEVDATEANKVNAASALAMQARLEALESPPKAIIETLKSGSGKGAQEAFEYLMGLEVHTIDIGLTTVRKSLWLTGIASLTVGVLTASTNTGAVLLAGAIGAIGFRLLRNVRGAHRGVGTEWASLIAVPPAGAIAAFGGTLIIHLAHSLELVGSAFSTVSPAGGELSTLAVAFLLGFSERYLDSMATKVADAPPPSPRGGAGAGAGGANLEATDGSAPGDDGPAPGAESAQAPAAAATESANRVKSASSDGSRPTTSMRA